MSSETVNITVNDHPISVPKGTNLVEAAQMLGIHVPHYCYHPKLQVVGNCRMCLIEMGMPKTGPDKKPVLQADGTPEIGWSARPQIACATEVAEGMAVKTHSKLVEECRQGVMEFLLINHPLDCPICDQAGECRLQEYSVDYGHEGSRFLDDKVKRPKKVDLGPRVLLDDERCILCSRCIRFCQEVAKDDVLGFTDRGGHTTLGCYPGKQLQNNYSLNTVDICPVGALTSKDFRFKMRVWFLKESKSVCTSCSTGCNILIGSREGVVHRYTPRENDAVNSCWMCDAGRLNYHWINDPTRLVEPRMRGRQVEWPEALREARHALREAGAKNELAIVASARASTEELFLIRQLADAYPASLVDIVERKGDHDDVLVSADKNPNTNGARAHGLVTGKLGQIREGIEAGRIKSLLVHGENLEKAGFSRMLLEKLQTLVVIDILPSPVTEAAGFVLPGAAHAEKRGTFINGKGRIQRFEAAFPPKGRAQEDWQILKELLPETDQPNYFSFDEIFKRMVDATAPLKGLTWQGLGDAGAELALKASS